MQLDLVSSLVGFVLGTATGAASVYLGNKLTDRRRSKESEKLAVHQFLDVKAMMPELIAEMKGDLSVKENAMIREFFVLRTRGICLGGSEKPRFVYYEDSHKDLRSAMTVLENSGYLIDVTPGNTPIFRMTEEFVSLVLRYG